MNGSISKTNPLATEVKVDADIISRLIKVVIHILRCKRILKPILLLAVRRLWCYGHSVTDK